MDRADVIKFMKELWRETTPNSYAEQAFKTAIELLQDGSRWVSRNKKSPEDQQKCLLILLMGGGKYVDVGTFSTDLYSVDKYAFADKKGVAGWYYRDSEYGFCEHYGVTAWMPLPEPYEGGDVK